MSSLAERAWRAGGLLCGVAWLPLAGCASPTVAVAAHSSGDFELARRQILAADLDGAKQTQRDRLLWLMEEGKICLDAGDAPTGAVALATASDWSERFAIYEPKTTVQEEVASVVVNSTLRTFRGTYSDRILVDAYAVLANLWVGDTGRAAVYGNRVLERQADAETEQAKQIAKVEKELGGYRGGVLTSMVKEVRGASELRALGVTPATSAYLNPFASWIAAIAWSATGDGANLTKAGAAFSRAAAMVPENPLLAQEAAENPFVRARSQPQVLILLEAGRCVSLRQVLIPVFTPWSGYNPIPIPVPETHPCQVASLSLQAGSTDVSTLPLSDNDAIFVAQYERMLPEIVFRTALMVGAKAGATVAATQATRRNDSARWAILAGMSLYQALTNQADLRSWTSVGKFTQIARVDRPPDGRLRIAVTTTSGATGPFATIDLPDAQVVFVYVRSMSPSSTVVYPFAIMPAMTNSTPGSVESAAGIAVRSPA